MGISKKMQLEEMDRISREEYDEDDRAKNDDAAFCAHQNYVSEIMKMKGRYDNDELVEVVESIQKKTNKEDK